MRVLVFGGRDYGDINPYLDIRTIAIFKDVEQYLKNIIEYVYGVDCLKQFVEQATKENPLVFISGLASGADKLCFAYADFPNVSIDKYPADWNKHGKIAGFIRNQQMIDDGKPDIAIGFPGGNGTKDMIKRLEKSNIKLIKFTGE